jgi:hypothetical protein
MGVRLNTSGNCKLPRNQLLSSEQTHAITIARKQRHKSKPISTKNMREETITKNKNKHRRENKHNHRLKNMQKHAQARKSQQAQGKRMTRANGHAQAPEKEKSKKQARGKWH